MLGDLYDLIKDLQVCRVDDEMARVRDRAILELIRELGKFPVRRRAAGLPSTTAG